MVYYCRDHFWGPLRESGHARVNIRFPFIKRHGLHCNPGIDGGVKQNNIEFQFFVWHLRDQLCILAAITSGAP